MENEQQALSIPFEVRFETENDLGYLYLAKEDTWSVKQIHGITVEGAEWELIIDIDEDNRLVGIEILGASKALPERIFDGEK